MALNVKEWGHVTQPVHPLYPPCSAICSVEARCTAHNGQQATLQVQVEAGDQAVPHHQSSGALVPC